MPGMRTPFGFKTESGGEVILLYHNNRRGYDYVRITTGKRFIDIRISRSGRIIIDQMNPPNDKISGPLGSAASPC
jgi:hypothetical protein